MDLAPIRIIVHEGDTYVEVVEFVDAIITDLNKAPSTMLATRDEIILALKQYVDQALRATEA